MYGYVLSFRGYLRQTTSSSRWQVLEQVLQLIIDCKTLEDYKRLAEEGRHILNVLPGGILRLEHSNADSKEDSPALEDASTTTVSEHTSNSSVAVAPNGD